MNIKVGIQSGQELEILFRGKYCENGSGPVQEGKIRIVREKGGILLDNGSKKKNVQLPLAFHPLQGRISSFELQNVTIGIDFHWERKENQQFRGSLLLIEENDSVTAVNILDTEDYLLSVIASEMNATSSAELLKAHAVISRSWLLAQKEKAGNPQQKTPFPSHGPEEEEYIRWFDREDHLHFDVCADDHCQRYQGIQKATTSVVREAVKATRGEILRYEGKICDTRFSKCCGGISENFKNVWQPRVYPYLQAVYDGKPAQNHPDPSSEEGARIWVTGHPACFCNTHDKRILSQVLNDYDLETTDFFRWEVYYTRREISDLIRKKSGIDFGLISGLTPVERGASGRLVRLRITGEQRSLTIGKELIIRRFLSPTHLYSSAFIVEKDIREGEIRGFRLRGAGWGHGVGLCQIGAAVMSEQGYSYREILSHYFPGSTLEKAYE